MPSAWRLTQTPLQSHEPQSKPRIEFSSVVGSAAGQARDGTPYATDARKFLSAIWATINETCRVSLRWKWQSMTALLVTDSQIVASPLPLGAMSWDPASTGAKLGKNVSEFVPQCAIDFLRMIHKPQIQ